MSKQDIDRICETVGSIPDDFECLAGKYGEDKRKVIKLSVPDLKLLRDELRRLQARNEVLTEALTWAVGFIRCNTTEFEEYPDFQNAASLVADDPLIIGPLQIALFENEILRARNKVLEGVRAHYADKAIWFCRQCGDNTSSSCLKNCLQHGTPAHGFDVARQAANTEETP